MLKQLYSCGIPLYANKPVATCKNCNSQRQLSLNPRILGSFLDESGMITGNKLIWNDQAWTELFFEATGKTSPTEIGGHEDGIVQHSWQDITTFETNWLRDAESELLYSRITLTFGWSMEQGRLCIIAVEW